MIFPWCPSLFVYWDVRYVEEAALLVFLFLSMIIVSLQLFYRH